MATIITRSRSAGSALGLNPAPAKRAHHVVSRTTAASSRRARNSIGASIRRRKEAVIPATVKTRNFPLPLALYACAGQKTPFLIPYPRGFKIFVLEPEVSSPLERETLWNTQFNGRRSSSNSDSAIAAIDRETGEPYVKSRRRVSFAEKSELIGLVPVNTDLADAIQMLDSTAL